MSCSSPAHHEQNQLDFPTVTINNAEITPEMITREIQYHPAPSAEQARDAAIKALLVQQALLQRAHTLGLNNELASGDITVSNHESEDEALTRVLLEREVQTPRASEEDCQRYFDANRAKFTSGNLVEASHILIAGNPQDLEARHLAKTQAESLIAQLQQSPELFAALAAEHSACPSKEVGGNLGQLSKGQTTPEFERQVLPLDAGLCPTPVESRYGYHVVQVDRKIEGKPLEFEHVFNDIAAYLNETSLRRGISQYIQLLLSECDIQGFEGDFSNSPLVQ